MLWLLVAIALIHIGALHFAVYWNFVWFDTFVHFLGGFWVASVVLFVLRLPARGTGIFFSVILGTLCFGIGWEVFEYLTGSVIVAGNYGFDTTMDIVSDIIGGIAGFSYIQSKGYNNNNDKKS
jgi:hypothetical protein